jgi:hypothetical protein
MSTVRESLTLTHLWPYTGLIVGLGTTAMSMSAGFIWASQGKIPFVYLAGFFSWTGYLIGHFAVTGVFVDDLSEHVSEIESSPDDGSNDASNGENNGGIDSIGEVLARVRNLAPEDPFDAVGFILGIGILVSGIAILAWFVRREAFLLGNIGSGMFLSGYVIAHYFDTGKAL